MAFRAGGWVFPLPLTPSRGGEGGRDYVSSRGGEGERVLCVLPRWGRRKTVCILPRWGSIPDSSAAEIALYRSTQPKVLVKRLEVLVGMQ